MEISSFRNLVSSSRRSRRHHPNRDDEEYANGYDDGLSTGRVETSGRAGFQFKVGRACRDFNVQNAYAKLFAPLVATASPTLWFVFAVRVPTPGALDGNRRWTTSVPTRCFARRKISKSDASSSRKGCASRTLLADVKPARGHECPLNTLKSLPPKDKLPFWSNRHTALAPSRFTLRDTLMIAAAIEGDAYQWVGFEWTTACEETF